MAEVEYWVGSEGPFLADDILDAAALAQGGQVVTHDSLLADMPAATTVVSATSFGLLPAVGVLKSYAREDHSHGTPGSSSSVTEAPMDGKIYVRCNGAWQELVIS